MKPKDEKGLLFLFFRDETSPQKTVLNQWPMLCYHECHISVGPWNHLPSHIWQSKGTHQIVRRNWIDSTFFFFRTDWDENHYEVFADLPGMYVGRRSKGTWRDIQISPLRQNTNHNCTRLGERLREEKKEGEKENKVGKAHGRSPLPCKNL